MEGVIVKNNKKKGYNYLSGEQILLDYWKDDERVIAYHNNLEDIWDALLYRYQTHSNKMEIVEHLMNKIVSIFIFDIITCQADRHSLNWEVEESNDSIDIVSLYDNEEAFSSLGKYNFVQLTVNDVRCGNLLQELRTFLKTSCKDYMDLLKDKLWIISDENLVSVFNRIEVKTGYSISEIEKEYYLELCRNHKENLEKEIILYENNLESDEQNERKNR